MIDFYTFLFLFAPGALAYLVAHKLSGDQGEKVFSCFLEWLTYSMITIGIVSVTVSLQRTEAAQEEAVSLVPITLPVLWLSLLIALLVGVVASFVKQMEIRALIERDRPGFFARLSPRGRGVVRKILAFLCLCAIALAVCYPRLEERRLKALDASYKETAVLVYNGVVEQVTSLQEHGTSVEEWGDLNVGKITVKRVTQDQHYVRAGSGTKGYRAVYMVDGNGKLVYFSIQDQTHGSTWSGASEDEDFIQSNNGWNGGLGAGWTGVKLF